MTRAITTVMTPYLGHGGGVCAEDTAAVTFVDCNFSGNRASVGGGLFGAKAKLKVSDSEFISNRAYQGGGMFGQNGPISIKRCNSTIIRRLMTRMTRMSSAKAADFIYGRCRLILLIPISSNNAEAMGGGAYFGGEGFASLLRNCFLVGNSTGEMGGAVAATTFSQLKIANCTIADNAVTVGGTNTGFGGGLYCSYNSYVNIINSIIWGNFGTEGAQLALSTGFKSDPRPSTADVKYSVIGPPRDVNVIIEPAEALTINVTNDANVLVNTILGPGIELVGHRNTPEQIVQQVCS